MLLNILINILIILLAMFMPVFIKAVTLSRSTAFNNINTSMEYHPANNSTKTIQSIINNAEKILEENNLDNFSVDKFYDNLR